MKMLEQLQPFKFAFRMVGVAGLWRNEGHSKLRRIISKFIFIWLHPVAAMFLILSIPQAENIEDFAKSAFFSCVSVNSSTYGSVFILCSKQMEDLIADMGRIFSEHPEARKMLALKCRKIFKTKVPKYFLLYLCVALAIINPALTGNLSTPIYTPDAMKGTTGYFIFSWMYANLDMIYIATITTLVTDSLLECLFCIDAYIVFFKNHLQTVDFSGADGKEKLIECIEIHLNIKRVMKKYVRIAAFPIAMNLLLGAILNCTVAFTVVNNSDSGQSGFLVALGLVLMTQMFLPCHSAQNIESASEDFMDCLLQSNWMDADVRLKKSLLFFMRNLAWPVVKFNLFGIMDVNLKTFLNIINTTFSAYTLLNSLK